VIARGGGKKREAPAKGKVGGRRLRELRKQRGSNERQPYGEGPALETPIAAEKKKEEK